MKFFNVCVDNFFKNPDKILNFADNLNYYYDKKGRWPGVRSVGLHEIDQDLNNLIVSKIFRAYYSNNNSLSWNNSLVVFHKTKSYKDKILNEGWIHVDSPNQVSGLVYLTKNANLEGGTNIYQLKNKFKNLHNDDEIKKQKHFFYANSPEYDYDKYKEELRNHNDKFDLITKFNNVYNRMVMWSSNEYHAANSFEKFNENERLTMLFFINGIKSDTLSPYDCVNELDDNIESKLCTI